MNQIRVYVDLWTLGKKHCYAKKLVAGLKILQINHLIKTLKIERELINIRKILGGKN